MEPLNDVDSRILFHRRIFNSDDACPEHLKCVSNEILKKCGGLPLAILTIGGILASHQEVGSTEIWEKIMHSFCFQLETNRAFEWLRHVFNLGYNDLSLELKTCMLYLGVFPEDHKIVKDDLLRRWIAEGFVTEKHGDIQEIAESYLNELINRNMIQIAEFNDCGEVFSCRVHDLLLDYIILKCTEENFITIINGQRITKGPLDVRRLSLHDRNLESSDMLEKMSLTQARSFNLWGPSQQLPPLKKFHVLENMSLTQARSFNLWGPSQRLPPLKKFQLLRVLHLDIYDSRNRKYDMACILSLFQLRYLSLRTSGIPCKKLLTQLHKLKQLKTLDIVSKDEIFILDAQMLPSTLRHVILQEYLTLSGGVGHLRDLCTLSLSGSAIQFHDVERMKELGELTNLRELKLYAYVSDTDTCDVLLSSLCKLGSLRSLIFGYLREEDALARWSPPPRHIRRLHVLKCLFSTIPADWITQLHNLSSLEIKVRSLPSDGVDVLARLTMLVHLRLHVNERVPPEGFVVFHRAAFPNLRELWFRWEAPCLAFEEGTMPRLRSLVIDCYEQGPRQADGVLDGIEHLGSLMEFKVHVYEREGYIRKQLECADFNSPRVEEQRRWDGRSLEAAFKEAIGKHPGSLRVVIKSV